MAKMNEFESGKLAVITGGASGIGLAAAKHFAKAGMHIALVDQSQAMLDLAMAELKTITHAKAFCVDVSNASALQAAAELIDNDMGDVAVLFANAGIQPGSRFFVEPEEWRRIIDVNFWGIVNTINAFVPTMIAAKQSGRILITGSKQGITTPPGDPAYNISKSAVKTYAEALAHELRNTSDCKLETHLVIPGFVWTPLTYQGRTEKPAGAWTAEQTIDFIMQSIERNDFYILCPDNDVTRSLDEKRIAWASGDIIHNRPPLSRWHKDYADAFTASLKS